VPFAIRPSNYRLWDRLGSYERNGMINQQLSRNWVRFIYPAVPMFFMIYLLQPVIYGIIQHDYYANYQWEGIYHKYGKDRMVYCDNTITRLA